MTTKIAGLSRGTLGDGFDQVLCVEAERVPGPREPATR
jgi:hypothetical protein